MASSSGTSLFKRETVKSESVKLEFGRKIDLSAIPRAPTAAPVSVKAQETKDVKANWSLFPTATPPPREARRRFFPSSINYQIGSTRIRAHFDRHKQSVRFTIINGYAPAAGDKSYDTAQEAIFRQLRVKAKFYIQPKNPDYFTNQVAAAMAIHANKARVEIEVAVEPYGTSRVSVANPLPFTATPSTQAPKAESQFGKTASVDTKSQAAVHITVPAADKCCVETEVAVEPYGTSRTSVIDPFSFAPTPSTEAPKTESQFGKTVSVNTKSQVAVHSMGRAPNSMFAITEKTRETVKQTTETVKSTLTQPFRSYAQKGSPFANVTPYAAAPQPRLPKPPSPSLLQNTLGVKQELTPDEKPDIFFDFESPLRMLGGGFDG